MLAAVEDIAGQAADGQVGPPQQHQDQTDHDNDQASPEQHFADFGHSSILKGKALIIPACYSPFIRYNESWLATHEPQLRRIHADHCY